jgi:AraC family transcriptional regulator
VFRIPERKVDVQVEIVNVEPIRIAMLTHRGPVNQLNATVARFIEWRKATGLSPVERCRTFGLAWDNPDTTPPEQFRFGICGEVDGRGAGQSARRGAEADSRRTLRTRAACRRA